jgi:catechol 2,3-dioxygenase-like lactoylglutathione lyase family enzyme
MTTGKEESLDAIDHVAVSVTDIKAAVAWYSKQFRCTVEYQDETWAFLKFNNIRLALVIPSQHPAHLAFKVSDAEQYGQLETHRDGTRSVYVKDPAGNAVELVDRKSMTANKVHP